MRLPSSARENARTMSRATDAACAGSPRCARNQPESAPDAVGLELLGDQRLLFLEEGLELVRGLEAVLRSEHLRLEFGHLRGLDGLATGVGECTDDLVGGVRRDHY